MAIQSRRGNISNFDKGKMLPGEWGIALDSQEAFVCFGAGITKKMATYEDYQDMIDECVEITETAQGVVDSFNNLEIEKLAIDDASVSYITGWSSEKISKYDSKDNTVSLTEATTRENIATGEKHSIIFGKIKKFFSDLKTVAFTGKYTDLTNVAIENPTNLPTASADTLGKIYRDGTGLKITLRSGVEGSYTYSWVPFISKDKVVNSFNVTEDGFVADARGLKVLKDGLDGVNNNFINMHEYQKFMFKYIDISSTDGLDSGTNLYYKDIDLTQYLVGGTAIIASFACNAYIPAGVDKYIVASGILSNADKIIRVYFNKQITSAFSLSVFCIYK